MAIKVTSGFSQALADTASKRASLLCVGLDPREADAGAAIDSCFRLIDATAEFTAAFKTNSAFFEAFGAEGVQALRRVVEHVPEEIPVILDAKRGDIADTSEAYARAAFDELGASAITVNPYLGGDALAPLLARPDRGAFVLCRTSNPGADEFQELECVGRPLYEIVAERARAWNVNDNVGLVVGATQPAAVARLRQLCPDMWFLVPGIGAQGGDLEAVVSSGVRADGLGLLINVSRAIARSADPAAEARRLRDEMNQIAARTADSMRERGAGAGEHRPTAGLTDADLSRLADDLIATDCVRLGEFTLKSGIISPIYLDLRRLVSHPDVLHRTARSYSQVLAGLRFDRLAGIPYAGLPIATAISLAMNRPLIYPRRETKSYGTRAEIEGDYRRGETAAVVDDLATTGGTKIESIQKLEDAGMVVRDIVVLIDREGGAGETLAAAGYRLHSVVTLSRLLDEWLAGDAITREQFQQVKNFLGRE